LISDLCLSCFLGCVKISVCVPTFVKHLLFTHWLAEDVMCKGAGITDSAPLLHLQPQFDNRPVLFHSVTPSSSVSEERRNNSKQFNECQSVLIDERVLLRRFALCQRYIIWNWRIWQELIVDEECGNWKLYMLWCWIYLISSTPRRVLVSIASR